MSTALYTSPQADKMCGICANDKFERPATETIDGVDYCRRHANHVRAQLQSVPKVTALLPNVPISERQPTFESIEVSFSQESMMTKADYLQKYGPAKPEDAAELVRDLPVGSVMFLPLMDNVPLRTLAKRYRRRFSALRMKGYVVVCNEKAGHIYVEHVETVEA